MRAWNRQIKRPCTVIIWREMAIHVKVHEMFIGRCFGRIVPVSLIGIVAILRPEVEGIENLGDVSLALSVVEVAT
jgi:hypothetical protein